MSAVVKVGAVGGYYIVEVVYVNQGFGLFFGEWVDFYGHTQDFPQGVIVAGVQVVYDVAAHRVAVQVYGVVQDGYIAGMGIVQTDYAGVLPVIGLPYLLP